MSGLKKKKVGRKSKMPNKEMFETLYYNDNVSAKDIAKIYEVNEQTIYNWAHKFRNESNLLDSNKEVSDKQIFRCLNNNTKKERSKKTV